jgi:hypothetical protein
MTENEMKRRTLELLLPQCPYVIIAQFDKNSVFPEEMKSLGPNVVIRFGRTKGVMEMPDLVFDDKGFTTLISIQGRKYTIRADWESVLQLYTLDAADNANCVVGWSRWIQGQAGTAKSEAAPEPKRGLYLVKSD